MEFKKMDLMLMTFVAQIQLCHKSQKKLHAVLTRDRTMRHICLQEGNLSKAGFESVKKRATQAGGYICGA